MDGKLFSSFVFVVLFAAFFDNTFHFSGCFEEMSLIFLIFCDLRFSSQERLLPKQLNPLDWSTEVRGAPGKR